VDAIGLSVLSGAHMPLFTSVLSLLKERGGEGIVVFGGGIIPDSDRAALKEAGVGAIFTPGASTESIIAWLREHVAARNP
jgi:methylmalonyl-CoA mutase C-terminal domain/subunit